MFTEGDSPASGIKKTLLIDLDGVIRRWPSSYAGIEASCGLPEGAIQTAAFEKELLHSAILGRIGDAEWRKEIVTSLARAYPQALSEVAVAQWSSLHGEVDSEVVSLVTNAKTRMGVVLITNATSRLDADLTALGLQPLFDGIINSSEVGVAKPDPEIFRYACQFASASAETCLFVDDSAANVAAAAAMGMQSHLFRTCSELSRFLASAAL